MIRVVGEDLCRVGSAKPHRMLYDRLEDRLKLEPGTTDCLDHLVRRGLLLEQREVRAQLSFCRYLSR